MNPVLAENSRARSRPQGKANETYRVAVIGATGAVGSEALRVLSERDFPVSDLVPFASPKSEGQTLKFGHQELACAVLDEASVQGFDLVISAAGSSVILEWAPKFVEAGAIVIDKSSAFRMEKPLIVPEVNKSMLDERAPIIASPNCSTIQLVLALAPIHREVGIERVVVSTYQSVSGTGQNAIKELDDQSRAVLDGREVPDPTVYQHQIAFNAIPQVETFEEGSDFTTEEKKLVLETQKILDDENLGISATCVRVPVRNAHSESVNVQLSRELSPGDCRDLLRDAPGIRVVDDPAKGLYPLAIDAAGHDEVLVGRIRRDSSHPRCLNLWVVGDNLRKGAATNAVQIAELLVERGFLNS